MPLPKSMHKWQHAVMLPEGETRRQMMAPPLQSCLQVLSCGYVSGSYQLQITTECFYALFCLSPPAAPLSLPSSPPLPASLGTRTSHGRELPSALLLITWAVNARLDGQLHKLPYSLAGASCQGHAGPLSTKDKKYISS